MNKDLQILSQVRDFLGKAFVKMPRKSVGLYVYGADHNEFLS